MRAQSAIEGAPCDPQALPSTDLFLRLAPALLGLADIQVGKPDLLPWEEVSAAVAQLAATMPMHSRADTWRNFMVGPFKAFPAKAPRIPVIQGGFQAISFVVEGQKTSRASGDRASSDRVFFAAVVLIRLGRNADETLTSPG